MRYVTLLLSSITLSYATPRVEVTCTPFYSSSAQNECVGGSSPQNVIGAQGSYGQGRAIAEVFHISGFGPVWEGAPTRVWAQAFWDDTITFYSDATITMTAQVERFGIGNIGWSMGRQGGSINGTWIFNQSFHAGDTLLLGILATIELQCGSPRPGCLDDGNIPTPYAAGAITLFPRSDGIVYSSSGGYTWFYGAATRITGASVQEYATGSEIPEPGTFMMLGSAVALGWARYSRRT